jgi:hypothetical protein
MLGASNTMNSAQAGLAKFLRPREELRRSSSIARSASISSFSAGGLTANERIRPTESVPQIVYLMNLLTDERCGAGIIPSLAQTAMVTDIIALLHFADVPMEQAGSDHLVLP